MNKNIKMPFLTKRQVVARTGLSAVTIWRRIKAGDFPPSYQLSTRRVGWLEADIEEWEMNRPPVQPKESYFP